ncbi:MAG: PAS domain S-box protein [Desulfobacterales bacterium]|nr:PAS domain S-box protein [Desulfobacterales bacterium]
MATKPSYSELEKKVKSLEKELAGHHRTEKLMWDKQDHLFKALDSLDAIVYVSDIQTYEILFANRYTEELFGDITGKICWQVLQYNMTGPCPFCKNSELVTLDGKPKDMILWEFQNTVNDRWYAVRDRAIDWYDDNVVHLQIAVDISYRKEAEAALEASEEKFRTVADFTYDWEYWINEQGGLNYISPSCERITGYSAKEFEENSALLLDIIHPDDRSYFGKHLDEELETFKVCHLDFRVITRTGEERWISHYCQPVYSHDKKFLGRRASNRDTSVQKKAEEDLIIQSEMIKHFTNSVSHDLKNPAIAIHGLAKILRRKYGEMSHEKLENFFDQIVKSSEQIVTLSGDINAYISTRESPLNFTTLDLQHIWQAIREEFVPQLRKRKISWIESEKSIPRIRADQNGLLRAYRNLVDNALKYGGSDLSAITMNFKTSATHHVLSVQNNGELVPVEEIDSIFEVFNRRVSESAPAGTGLGLAIVMEVAKHHKGKSWVESGADGKTTFYISIAQNL